MCTCLKNTEILLSCAQDKSPPTLSCLIYPWGDPKCSPLLFLWASGSSCAGTSHFLLGVRRVRGRRGGANAAPVSRALGCAASAGGDCLRKSASQGKGFVAESGRFLATKTPLAFALWQLSLRRLAALLERCSDPSLELLRALSAWQEPCLGDGRVGAAGTQRQQKRIATIARSRPQRPLRPRWRLLWSPAHPKTT